MVELLSSHSVITPTDLFLAAVSTLAALAAWFLDRQRGLTLPRDPMRYLVVWVRYFFGVHAFMSGANYFIQWHPQMIMEHELAGPFQHYMTEMGLFGLVKAVETLVALCLIFNVYVPVALLLEMPISVVIFFLSSFVVADSRTLWTGPREILMNMFLLAAYGGYFLPLLKLHVPQRPLWTEWGRRGAQPADATVKGKGS